MAENLLKQLTKFRSHYAVQTLLINHLPWSYYDIGRKNNVIVIFPDIMGTYESWFEYIPQLSKTNRVVIPFYPPISDIDEMVESLHSFLKRKKITTFTLIGSSLGGFFAQIYVRKYPKEVEKLLLLATGTSDKFFGIIAFFLFLVGLFLPQKLITFGVYLIALLCLGVEKNEKKFWETYLFDQIKKVDTRKAMLAWGRCILQICWKYTFHANDLKEWNRPLYLIESTNDLVFNPFTRHTLRRIYPKAVCYTLHGAKHLIWINRFAQLSHIFLELIP